ncbi:MAG: TldD/PmbA family protein, partial [Parasporobacterium sp.]|nr:TldD/PmbA family protein [Parasporobacterium sp.]
MKAKFSEYLQENAPFFEELAAELSKKYDYISLLATDSKGFSINCSQHSKSVSNSNITTERGCVVRVWKDGLYSEYAFNKPETADNPVEKNEEAVTAGLLRPEGADIAKAPAAGAGSPKGTEAKALAQRISACLEDQFKILRLTDTKIYDTPKLPDEEAELFVEKEAEVLPEEADMEELVNLLSAVSDQGMEYAGHAVECSVSARSTHISKLFLTPNRNLRQSYVYTEGNTAVIAAKDGANRYAYAGVSGLAGPEILEGLREKVKEAAGKAEAMLSAGQVVPGEYDIITTPGITGLIAHEAFGHGVEMDMFVKNRALGKDYIGKRVGSDLLTMHEGALCAENVTSYAFDDEGTLAGDVVEIEHGILKTGICDALSAVRLGVAPTGNGKRENFEHKVYTRMTNTLIDPGNDSLEDMIASISYGYLLDGTESGMEDPKHWGIQCIVSRGYEIKDGKLTGKMVSPVV